MDDPPTLCCPQCGQALLANAKHCADCARQTESSALDAYRSPPGVDLQVGATFSLATLLAMVTIVAASLGLGLIQPLLGILLFILCAPAYIRAGIILRRLRQAGATLRFAEDYVAAFFGSIGVLLATYLATSIAALAICYAGVLSGGRISYAAGATGQYEPAVYGAVVGLSVGGLSGLGVLIWTGRRWLPVEKAVASRLILRRQELPDSEASDS
jgi:uncharacterized membrane protein